MLPPLVLDTVPLPFSDGNPTFHPPVVIPTDVIKGYENPSPTALASWLAKCAAIATKEYSEHPERCPGFQPQLHGSVEFTAGAKMSDFPTGYRLLFLQRGTSGPSKVGDPYLFGHPTGSKFRSMPEFAPHLEWLVSDPSHDYANCLCKYCPRMVPRGSKQSTPVRPARARPASIKKSAEKTANIMEPIVIADTPPPAERTPRPKDIIGKTSLSATSQPAKAVEIEAILISDSTSDTAANAPPSAKQTASKKRPAEGAAGPSLKKTRATPAAPGVTTSPVISIPSPSVGPGALSQGGLRSDGASSLPKGGRANVPDRDVGTSAASATKADLHPHAFTPAEPLFRLGDVVWAQVYLALSMSHPAIIPLPLPTNPNNCVDTNSLRGKIAYWPAIVKTAFDRNHASGIPGAAGFWVPPLWHEPGQKPGDAPSFSPTHQHRNEPDWKGFAYILHLVDAPVAFTVLEAYVRPFAGFVLPGTLRVGASVYEQFARACSDEILNRYIATANKVSTRLTISLAVSRYTYALGKGPAPKVLPPPPDAPSGPPGPPSWEMIQIGAEHIRVHDFVRTHTSSSARPEGKTVISIAQVLGIIWKRDSAVQLICRQMVLCDADPTRDRGDPTFAVRWDRRCQVMRARQGAPLLTLSVENIIGRFYPSLKGIDGWAGPRNAVAVTQNNVELA
ncbi:hypothetical protein HDU86_005485 [Geranomyces michiganensis]|nr:hypothetical protein HDU86_005485 [Geranomyces michiganensis]